eukprot:TRINITY_DN67058_c8_g1_i1.p1 TRINITY_DN67058_c8_g1~~TRINITY_DN67058_c8_g1_i1.p1  ORF type:complete len:498 (-),score=39.05 TRINITY_DN67058_c8_g1_i1:676-2052(-)
MEEFQNITSFYSKWNAKYGPMCRAPLAAFGGREGVVIGDTTEMDEVFKKEGKVPGFVPHGTAVEEWFKRNEPYKSLGMQFLFNMEGEAWIQQRQAVQRKLLSPSVVKELTPVIADVAVDMLKWVKRNLGADNTIQEPLTTQDLAFFYGFEAVNTALYGTRLGTLDEDQPTETRDFIYSARQLFIEASQCRVDQAWATGGTTKEFEQMSKTLQRMLNLSDTYVTRYREKFQNNLEQAPESVLKDLMQNPDVTEIQTSLLLAALMLAGADTTANSILWLLHNFALNPEVQEKARQEIFDVMGDGAASVDGLNSLPYLKACIMESWRLTPTVAHNFRVLEHAVEIGGYDVPAGTPILFNKVFASRQAPFSEGDEFNPNQWLHFNKSEMFSANLAALNFGRGVRMCPGARVAKVEIVAALGTLLREFRITPVEDYEHPQPTSFGVVMPMPPPKLIFTPLQSN